MAFVDRDQAPSVAEALEAIWDYCVANSWTGWDPYDGLMTQLWPVRLLRRHRLGRLVLIQGVKRSPWNLRPLLRVPQLENAKALALGLDAIARLSPVSSWRKRSETEASQLADRLLAIGIPTDNGVGWGYPFDWQSRAFFIQQNVPTVVCTGFVVKALHRARPLLPQDLRSRVDEAIEAAASFVLHDLHRIADDTGFCWSYSPQDRVAVVNATLLGAETVARAASLSGGTSELDEIVPTLRWALARQNEEGGWAYGTAGHHQWEDGFHTAYNLLSLEAIRSATADLGRDPDELVPEHSVTSGVRHLASRFFDPDGRPWYYRHTPWPIDTHSAAVLILTMLAFRNDVAEAGPRAHAATEWALRNLWTDNGYFAYQIRPRQRIETSFLRWCQAWMLRALAEATVAEMTNP